MVNKLFNIHQLMSNHKMNHFSKCFKEIVACCVCKFYLQAIDYMCLVIIKDVNIQ